MMKCKADADYVRQILRAMPNGLDEPQFLRRCIEDVRAGYDNEVVVAFRIYCADGRAYPNFGKKRTEVST
jgi:hypothetical protein